MGLDLDPGADILVRPPGAGTLVRLSGAGTLVRLSEADILVRLSEADTLDAHFVEDIRVLQLEGQRDYYLRLPGDLGALGVYHLAFYIWKKSACYFSLFFPTK
jgi:hypothetical protein